MGACAPSFRRSAAAEGSASAAVTAPRKRTGDLQIPTTVVLRLEVWTVSTSALAAGAGSTPGSVRSGSKRGGVQLIRSYRPPPAAILAAVAAPQAGQGAIDEPPAAMPGQVASRSPSCHVGQA